MRKLLQMSFLVASGLGLVGCLPSYLEKYRQGRPNDPVAAAQPTYGNAKGGSGAQKPAPTASSPSSAIQSLGTNTYRFRLPMSQVWDSALTVLMKNYNITTLDKESGVITTEWDTFYLNDKVFRNKVTLHFRRSSWNVVDVALYNNVEVLQPAGTTSPGVWLPAKKGLKEVNRIVKNMAIALNQPQPVFPDEMVARAGESEE